MNINTSQDISQEAIRCIYCKKVLDDTATVNELSEQVHFTCKSQIDDFRGNGGKLSSDAYNELQDFFKKYNITPYRYLTREELYSLRRLNLNDRRISYIPKSIEKLENLRELALAGNNLTELPDEIGKMIHLRLLNLSYNKFKEFPVIIGELPFITQFMYAGNKLQSIPKEITNFSDLETLDLSHNEIQEFPQVIGEIQTLQRLYAQDNQLKKVPEEIRKLRNLRTLHLGNNEITNIPYWIEQNHYYLLNLTNNPIESIETKLQYLKAIMLNAVILQSEQDAITRRKAK